MTNAPMSTEIIMLGCAAALVILQIVLQAGSVGLFLPPSYLMGAQDAQAKVENVFVQRLARALRNLLETFPLFAAVALALAVTGRTGGMAALGAQIYVWARTAYLPLYVLGVPVARTLAWVASMAGIVMMLAALLGK